jgi:hypothetical protein
MSMSSANMSSRETRGQMSCLLGLMLVSRPWPRWILIWQISPCIVGTLHPMIHIGFGIEFKQPTVIAEALGQAAIHPTYLDSFFSEADEAPKRNLHPSNSLVGILDEIRADEKLSTAAHWDDQNQIRDGVLGRAKDDMVKYASQWRVNPENLEEATAELANAAGNHNLSTI